MTEPFSIGGVNIYVPEQKGLFKKAKAKKFCKVLPKEGELNVINYNGMVIKFPDQENIKIGRSSCPPFINLNSKGVTEIRLKDAEINGSPNNDRVESWCISSVFNFKDGGDDTIIHHKYNDGNYKEPDKNSLFNVDGNDYTREYHRRYDENGNQMGEYVITQEFIDNKMKFDVKFEPWL